MTSNITEDTPPTSATKFSDSPFRFPAELSSPAVWLHHCLSLSLRAWGLRFGRWFANAVKRRRPRPGDKWHLDEVLIRIRGKLHHLWRAVDQHGIVLDILVQSRRNAKAARRFFQKLPKGRCWPDLGLMHHSDRGSQYAAYDYRRLLNEHGMVCSMSRKGDCWDNAPMESFFGSLKTKLEDDGPFPTRQAARAALFGFIEGFYNRQRLHSAIGYISPTLKEQLAAAA